MFGKMSKRKEKWTEKSKLQWVCPKAAATFSPFPGGCRFLKTFDKRTLVGACRDEISSQDEKAEDQARIDQLNAIIAFLKNFKKIQRKAESGYYEGLLERATGTPLDKAINNLEKFKEQIATGQRNV